MAWNLQPVVIQAIYQTCVTIQMDHWTRKKDKKVIKYDLHYNKYNGIMRTEDLHISYMCVQELSDEKEEE